MPRHGTAGEQIATDMPPAMGGNASGPNPGWFFRASLASCCATVIAMRAALGVNLTTLEVTVESDGDHRGILRTRRAHLGGDVVASHHGSDRRRQRQFEQLADLVRWADGHSPVGCTVRGAPANTLDIRIV